ncbi:BQ5605_C005g03297 [Microbotryum silenes-dioicae]|uniref:Cytochrome c oxidase assembly factor 3 n=1 Tax=Microbotryum silenes-dioicae TaxID=796604 RepID=A0A2X0PCG9_9BASI|nr:BQ5605_C005g03297 [Microbotryum silenes-dioicae]
MSGPSTRAARATYHPQSGARISEGLARARRPFRTQNAITGALIFGFATAVYLYSIRAVAQDDFSDLDAPVQREGLRSLEDEQKERERLKAERVREWETSAVSTTAAPILETAQKVEQQVEERRGLLNGVVGKSVAGILVERGIWNGKGHASSIIPKAPDVDRIGTLWDNRARTVQEGPKLV